MATRRPRPITRINPRTSALTTRVRTQCKLCRRALVDGARWVWVRSPVTGMCHPECAAGRPDVVVDPDHRGGA